MSYNTKLYKVKDVTQHMCPVSIHSAVSASYSEGLSYTSCFLVLFFV